MKNETHESRTDPEAWLMRKGKEAKLVFMGHALMENRNGLLMDFVVSGSTGTAERDAVPGLLDDARERISIVDAAELGLGDDGRERLLQAHWVGHVLGVHAPEQCARVSLVDEDGIDAGLAPELSLGAGDSLVVEGPGDVRHPFARLGKVEDVLDDAGGIRVGLQGGAFLRPVGHHDPVVAEGGVAGNPEAARGGLPHPSRDLLGEDISYPIDTKSSGSHGQKDLEPVNYGGPFRRPCVERAFLSGLVPSQHSSIQV